MKGWFFRDYFPTFFAVISSKRGISNRFPWPFKPVSLIKTFFGNFAHMWKQVKTWIYETTSCWVFGGYMILYEHCLRHASLKCHGNVFFFIQCWLHNLYCLHNRVIVLISFLNLQTKLLLIKITLTRHFEVKNLLLPWALLDR